MLDPRTTFSIPLSERAYRWVLRQATLARRDPDEWLDAYIRGRLDDSRGSDLRVDH